MHLEDIAIGDYLTPLDGGKVRDLAEPDEDAGWVMWQYGARRPDHSGRIYHVQALDFPFAVVNTSAGDREMIDLRDHIWKRLAPEFVTAAMQK